MLGHSTCEKTVVSTTSVSKKTKKKQNHKKSKSGRSHTLVNTACLMLCPLSLFLGIRSDPVFSAEVAHIVRYRRLSGGVELTNRFGDR